jgi:hypothetical protein
MYWAWNSGYINAKLEGTRKTYNGKKIYPFEFHIGGYMHPYYAIRPVRLELKESNSTKIPLYCDISVWLSGIDLKTNSSIMIPGKEAMKVADVYSKMFNTEKR